VSDGTEQPSSFDAALCDRLRWTSLGCGAAGALIAVIALIGWITDDELLKGGFIQGITMKTNAALGIALIGALVIRLALDGPSETRRPSPVAKFGAALVMAIGGATLLQHLFRVDLGIDQLLFRESAGATATESPNRMGPVAATCLALLGAARLAVVLRRPSGRTPFQYLALAVTLITSVPLLGYLFEARALFGIGKYTGIALPTAVALWLLSVGLLLSRPDVGFMRRLLAEDSGALLVRRLLPAAVLLPILLMLLCIGGEHLGLYGQTVGRALLVIGFILVFTTLVWRTGKVVYRQAESTAHAERELHRELARADRRKTEFLGVLAHELRNPLAPVRNAVHLLRARDGDGSEATHTYAVIERQIEHLARLIDDLMDVTRISQDRLELRKSRVRFSDIIAAALEGSRYLVDTQHHQISISLPPDEIELEADAARLVQVFTNLLSNAARYTPSAGRIALTAELRSAHCAAGSSELVVTLTDSGVGIAADQLPRIFEMFYQAREDERLGSHGLGIGLALVRKLVELHDGEVRAFSAGPGLGSSFTVRLPAAVAAPPPAAVPALPLEPALSAGQNLSVLIVEDNPDSADMLAELIGLTGARVAVAQDGESALEVGARAEPQLILLDIGLPGMSGYDVAREARSTPWGSRAFIAALTGWGSPDDRVRSNAAGVDLHLVKPVNPQALMKLIADLQGQRKADAPVVPPEQQPA
jgi:signal transduction histidine kinase/CheY-like chemotaxis protein